ncbi:MAG: hypothetical protein J0M07_20585 [Anaerolineae bacterium]|nr:hypothetical protein [Anaerolineae bacterium]
MQQPNVRPAIRELSAMGPMPNQNDPNIDIDKMESYQNLLLSVDPPVSADEARILATLFPADDFHELPWILLHLIESAPHWPLQDVLANVSNHWIVLLKQRVENDH